jgi:Uri superfamily endonuclease
MKVQKQIKSNCGIYILEIFVPEILSLGIQKFKKLEIDSGYYYYVGSAQKNLKHRIKRHLRKDKIIHWHIDHLTVHKQNQINTIFIFENEAKLFECGLVNEIENHYKLVHPLKGFGSSDCTNCKSHLLYSKNKIDHSHLFSRYQSIVRFIPSSSETS